MVEGVREQFPGYQLRRTSPVERHHDQVRFEWELVGPTARSRSQASTTARSRRTVACSRSAASSVRACPRRPPRSIAGVTDAANQPTCGSLLTDPRSSPSSRWSAASSGCWARVDPPEAVGHISGRLARRRRGVPADGHRARRRVRRDRGDARLDGHRERGAAERRHPARHGEQHELPPTRERRHDPCDRAPRSTAGARAGSGTSRCATTTAASARRRASRSRCGEHVNLDKFKIGFFSFTEITDPAEHHSYNEWHMLDHMPEQYPIPGIAYGQRWVSTPACRDGPCGERRAARPGALPHVLPHDRAGRGDAAGVLRARPCAREGRPLPPAPARAAVGAVPRARRRRRAACADPRRVGAVPAAPRYLRRRRGERARRTAPRTKLRSWEYQASPGCGRSDPGEHPSRTRGSRATERITVAWLDDDPLAVAAAIEPIERDRSARLVRGTVRDDHAVGVDLVRRPGVNCRRAWRRMQAVWNASGSGGARPSSRS